MREREGEREAIVYSQEHKTIAYEYSIEVLEAALRNLVFYSTFSAKRHFYYVTFVCLNKIHCYNYKNR